MQLGVVTKFDGKNHLLWSSQLRWAVEGKGLWDLVTNGERADALAATGSSVKAEPEDGKHEKGDAASPATPSPDAAAKLAARNQALLAAIGLTVKAEFHGLVRAAQAKGDAYAAYKALKARYVADARTHAMTTHKRLLAAKLSEGGNAEEHVHTLESLKEELDMLGPENSMDDQRMCVLLLSSLPPSWSVLTSVWESDGAMSTDWTRLRNKVVQEYHKR